MGEIPGDGILQSGRKAALRRPSKLALRLAGIDRVAEIVPRAVGDEADLSGIARAAATRHEPVENAAQDRDEINVGDIGTAAEQVSFARPASRAKAQEAIDVILDEQLVMRSTARGHQLIEGLRFAFPSTMKRIEPEYPGLVALHDRVAAFITRTQAEDKQALAN